MTTCVTITDTSAAAPRFAAERPSLASRVEGLAMQACGRLSCLPHALLGNRAQDRLGILVYHRIVESQPGVPAPLHNVTPRRFAEQVSGLLRRGWKFWPMRQVLEHRAAALPLPPKTAVLTFDDAFESVYHTAWPLLRAWQVPFTVFVCTQYLDSPEPMPFDLWGQDQQARVPPQTYRCMTTAQCQELLESGLVELGAHTHSHEDFRGRPEEFQQDLTHCLAQLEDRFGLTRVPFAFPYGSRRRGFASPELQSAARQAGVTCGLTTQAALVDRHTDPYCWGRFNVFPWDTSGTLAAKLSGWYSWTNRLRNWRSPAAVDCVADGSHSEGARP